jgi:hypothetical protein
MEKQKTTEAVQTTTAEIPAVWAYLTVNQFVHKHTAFTLGGLRSLIFNEHQNGLAKSGAITRIGKKILLREDKFFSWVELQNKVGA